MGNMFLLFLIAVALVNMMGGYSEGINNNLMNRQ